MSLRDFQATGEGAQRKRAEYVVLKFLTDAGPIRADKLDHQIKEIHQHLEEETGESPYFFRLSGSNGPSSSELNTAIQSLLHFDRIKNKNGEYQVTNRGQEYLEDEDKLDRDGIDIDFRELVADVMPC